MLILVASEAFTQCGACRAGIAKIGSREGKRYRKRAFCGLFPGNRRLVVRTGDGVCLAPSCCLGLAYSVSLLLPRIALPPGRVHYSPSPHSHSCSLACTPTVSPPFPSFYLRTHGFSGSNRSTALLSTAEQCSLHTISLVSSIRSRIQERAGRARPDTEVSKDYG